MTISEAIAKANSLRDNILTDSQKATLLYNLDCEIADIQGAPNPENVWPEADAVLLMPAPHDDIYPLYLASMIDYYNGDYDLYSADLEVYNRAMTSARAWWRRYNEPAAGKNYWRVM